MAPLADIRKLDAWAAKVRGRSWETCKRADALTLWSCVGWENGREVFVSVEKTPDEARRKAAREAGREADVRPAAEFCNAHPEDGEHERNKADRDHCVYCGARLAP